MCSKNVRKMFEQCSINAKCSKNVLYVNTMSEKVQKNSINAKSLQVIVKILVSNWE
jgi:hypothetical protein